MRDYDVIGFLRAEFGLAIAARNTVRSLRASGREVREVILDPARPRSLAVVTPTNLSARATPPVALFHLNPVGISLFEGSWSPIAPRYSHSACVPFWELPLVPLAWVPLLRAMDAILAPTRFIQSACARVVPPERVIHYPQAVFPAGGITPDRARWTLAPDALVFIVSFDVGSDTERKNPLGAIEAFQRAFPGVGDVQLVIKTRPAGGVREFEVQIEAIRTRARGDPRIRVVEASLPYLDVLQLYASCDVMVSLHRSEGLGLHLMEAMSLGKVVVATNWSGNSDFMTERNSVPVGHRLVPAVGRHPDYAPEVGRPGQVWAEPDVDEAAAILAALRSDAARRARIGEAAAFDMEARRRQVSDGKAFVELERVLAAAPGSLTAMADALRASRWNLRRVRLRGFLGCIGRRLAGRPW